MIRQLVQLWVGSLLIWGLLALPAWFWGSPTALIDTLAALGLCLAPMTATMLWCHWAFRKAPEQQLAAALGSTGIRLFVVIAGGIALYHLVNELHRPTFLLWVVVFYLLTLALEVIVIVRRQNAELSDRPHNNPANLGMSR